MIHAGMNNRHLYFVFATFVLSIIFDPITVNIAGRTPSIYLLDIAGILFIYFAVKKSNFLDTLRGNRNIFTSIISLMIFLIILVIYSSNDLLKDLVIIKLYLSWPVIYLACYSIAREVNRPVLLLFTILFVIIIICIQYIYNFYNYENYGIISGRYLFNQVSSVKSAVGSSVGVSNTIAGVVALCFPLLTLFFKDDRLQFKIIGTCFGGIMIYCMIISLSRAASLALIAGILIYFILTEKTFKKLSKSLLMGIMVLLIASYALPEIKKIAYIDNIRRVADSATENFIHEARVLRWEASLEAIEEQPLGYGINSYMYATSKSWDYGGSAHNILLDVWFDTTILGLIIFLYMSFKMIQKSIIYFRLAGANEKHISIVVLSCLCIFWVNCMLEPNYYSIPYMYLYACILGIAAAQGQFIKKVRQEIIQGVDC